MDGAPSGQAEQFPLTSVRKSLWSASGIEPRTLCISSRPRLLTTVPSRALSKSARVVTYRTLFFLRARCARSGTQTRMPTTPCAEGVSHRFVCPSMVQAYLATPFLASSLEPRHRARGYS
eukprot:5346027-Prymnesium_polylepis.1